VYSPRISELLLTWSTEISAYGLAKAVGDYIESARATDAIYGLLKMTGNTEFLEEASSRVESRFSGKIWNRTARRWLEKLGFSWRKIQKGVYVDGHERSDVVRYRQEVFLPAFNEIRPYLVTWDKEGQMIMPQNLPPGWFSLLTMNQRSMQMTGSGNSGWRTANNHYGQRLEEKV
jgi:hypothetical protein